MHITIQQLLSDETSDFRDYYIESKHNLSTTYINSKLRYRNAVVNRLLHFYTSNLFRRSNQFNI